MTVAAVPPVPTPTVGELWTARQRQGCSLHEISYRACFKPQLPGTFIARWTRPGDVVLDPFAGRGTTVLEAALQGRIPVANDINPLSEVLSRPRLEVPLLSEIEHRLDRLVWTDRPSPDRDLSMFYHPETLGEILALKRHLHHRKKSGREDPADRWIRMVATNRLTGHSPGFFSIYTLPPNQATTAERQIKINRRLKQKPEYRDVKKIILKKSSRLLRDVTPALRSRLREASVRATFRTGGAERLEGVRGGSVDLTVTSPPFLDIVNYTADKWLRNWFNGIDGESVGRSLTVPRTLEVWSRSMAAVFAELFRVTRGGGRVAFEVGEVRGGKVRLEEAVLPLGRAAGFEVDDVLINSQRFTKTSHIWGVANNAFGTNTNRVVLFRK